ATIDFADYQGRTPLHEAAYYGYQNLVEFFLDKGHPIDPLDNFGQMRGSFFSDETAATHAHVARLRHALRNRVAALQLSILRCAFAAWRNPAMDFWTLASGRWTAALQTVISLLGRSIAHAGRDLRRLCRRDKKAYLEGLADAVDSAAPGETQTALRRLLRPRKFRRGGPLPLPLLKRPDGSVCQSFDAIQQEWRRHFADLEGGQQIPPEQLAVECVRRQAGVLAKESLDCAVIPDLVQLREAFRNVSPLKATGPDGIPPALCRGFATPLATVFWPVLLKTLCFGSEPVGYKGGVLFHIPKPGAKDKGVCSAERGILVQSTLEKVLHKALRPIAVDGLNRSAMPLQLGGRAGYSHSMGFYCARLFLDFARHQGLSAGILFCDLAAAYYAIVRETLIGRDLHSAPIEVVAGSLGLTSEDLQALQFFSAEEPVLAGKGGDALLHALAKEFHTDSWFLLHQDSALVRTRRGTRPGSSWADTMFSLLFARVLKRRGDFAVEGYKPIVPWSGERRPVAFDARRAGAQQIDVQDIVYADDLATCIVSSCAAALPQAVRHVAGCSFDALLSHGLKPNVGPTKTSAMLVPIGVGARNTRTQVFTQAKGKLPVLCDTIPTVHRDVVPTYRHLGSVLTFGGSMLHEARARVHIARQLFREGRATVFCTPHIALPKRVLLLRSHVLAAMFSGCGAWPELCQSSWKQLNTCLFNMLRAMLRIPHDADQRWSAEMVLGEVGLPDLRGLLAADRLRFLAQLVRTGPCEAFALLQHSPRALAAFRSAADWFVQACEATSPLRGLGDSWEAWHQAFLLPRRFRGLLKRATAWHVGALRAMARFQAFCRQHWDPVPPPVVDVEVATHACLLCSVAFFDFHSWSAHAARTHGYRSRARRFAAGLTCRACGVRFATLVRHQRHLQQSVRCCQAVEWDLPTLFPVDQSTPGHIQSVSAGGGDFCHVPEAGPDVAVSLLRSLRVGTFREDVDIFEVVKATVEPLHVLRNTLEFWIAELPPGQLRDSASDVLLCLRADLLCDSASRVRKCKDAPVEGFEPLLRPLPLVPLWEPFPLLLDSKAGCGAPLDSLPLPWPDVCSVCFWSGPPAGLDFAGLSISIPAPPFPLTCVWQPVSCTLRELRKYDLWLRLLFAWLSFALLLA
ncbi:unnamed protein product, partial [Symbiodinium sp. CCMP2456]